MLFSWFELLLLVGVIQGLITSFVLIRETRAKVQNRLLGLGILALAAICLKIAIYSIGLESIYPWLEYIPLAFETAIPPLVYLYCKSLTEPEFRFTKLVKLHFLPFAFFMFYALCFYLLALLAATSQEKVALLRLFHLDLVKEIEDYFTVASISVYLILGTLVLKKFRKQAENYTSDNNHRVFSWLRSIQMLMIFLVIFLIANMIIDRAGLTLSNSNNHWKIYFLYLAGVVYYLGFKASKSPVIMDREALESPEETEEKDYLPDPKTQELATKIENMIETQELFLNPTFSIRDLSERVEVNQSTVSQIINRHLGFTFRDLINQKRIEKAQRLLLLNKDKSVSILSQALECGFNSEASFYRVFKKHTGLSPTQYIKTSQND